MEDVVKFPVDASKLDPSAIIALIAALLTQFGPQILTFIQAVIAFFQQNPSATMEEALAAVGNPVSLNP